ncbi:hypothetical protein AB0D10_08030 [Kitasatospora sp. NPDC048545]|uniref:hypothetical protein n=1 Tax=Kitasatospora sp. NPDC048545 TaxID=3157208 RepID=UPI0033C9D254
MSSTHAPPPGRGTPAVAAAGPVPVISVLAASATGWVVPFDRPVLSVIATVATLLFVLVPLVSGAPRILPATTTRVRPVVHRPDHPHDHRAPAPVPIRAPGPPVPRLLLRRRRPGRCPPDAGPADRRHGPEGRPA